MPAIIMDGNKLKKSILENVKTKVDNYVAKGYRRPILKVIIIGDDFASQKYVKNKLTAAASVGFKVKKIQLKDEFTKAEIISIVKKENKGCDGLLVQFPLPKQIRKTELIEILDPTKDVDGLCPLNIGSNISSITNKVKACTPKGIIRLLDEYKIDLKGKIVAIINSSKIVGRPLMVEVLNRKAVPIVLHRHAKNLDLVKTADIVVVATGIPNFLTKDMIKKNAVVIDVGINSDKEGKLVGDVDFKNVSKVASYITPVPGGVGPLTIASLIENCLELYEANYLAKNKKLKK